MEHSPNRQPKTEQEQRGKSKHGDTSPFLNAVGIIVQIHGLCREMPLFDLVGQRTKRGQMERTWWKESRHPKFDERRVLRIQSKIPEPQVTYASGDVIRLIDVEAVKMRGNC